ncbi:hypothetical protein [Methanooceanicella nereidis]|uniref:hypothetical protein n=1 Tax=Methanooceanicella nereidis TaxID=2052831 RepID=UPI001E4EE8BF|nr:hypothetical protein [Methanocella sp. CWC-04]
MNLMRIPLATVIFIGSIFLLTTYFNEADSVFGTIGAFFCIIGLVFSFMLYSNLNIVK